ncbi:MAG: transglutaminase-like domain-containing protein [Acidobacteriota bacterium]|jgi:regulator of sirC expression with transglutaminase-like and TPR domain
MLEAALEPFARMAVQDGRELRLDRGALEIARVAHPDLEAGPWLERLDRLAERTWSRRRSAEGPLEFVGLLNRSLFRDEGFRGDRASYYSPRNSCLNDVLQRRSGIPITLAVVYLEVSRRLGLPVAGIGFPGHFLIRAREGDRELLLDPFDGGRTLTPDDCQHRLDRVFGAGVELDPRFLQTVDRRQILTRVLRNLKRAYLSRRDSKRALAVVERLLALRPDLAEELRDRGKLLLRHGRTRRGADDLQAYLDRVPGAVDGREIRLLLSRLRRAQARVN